MKKIINLIIITIFFIPIVVNAAECDTSKVFIDSIGIDKSEGHVIELKEASAKNKQVDLNLRMSNKNDEIRYKVVLKNESEEDYEINKDSISINSEYIEYTLESESDDTILKANTSKTVYLKVKYKTEVDQNSYENGTYEDKVTMKVNLKTEDDTINILNPDTGVSYILIISFILIISGVLFIIFKKNKISTLMIIIGLIILPIGVKALCTCDLVVDSKVQIVNSNSNMFCIYNIENNEPVINYYPFEEHETFYQYMERNPSQANELGLYANAEYSEGRCDTISIMYVTLEQLLKANLNDSYYDQITTIKYPDEEIIDFNNGCYHIVMNGRCM